MISPLLPLPFYLCCFAAVFLGIKAWKRRIQGWGIPMGAVVATASVWYIGDALYNEYGVYVQTLGAESLTAAWWEVFLFFISFGILVPLMNRRINGDLEPPSGYQRLSPKLREWLRNEIGSRPSLCHWWLNR